MNITNENQAVREVSVSELEQEKEKCKFKTDFADALKRLVDNPDFIKVFEQYYCQTFATRQVTLLAEPMLKEEQKQNIIYTLRGIAEFQAFIRMVFAEASMAKKTLNELNDAEAEFYNSNTAEIN